MAYGKVNANKVQLGNDVTATNNFLLKIPASPNGTVVLSNGNDGAETDLIAFNSTGNIVMNSGKGIDFSATANSSGTMTSELLNDYEEGTWTPTLGAGSGALGSGNTTFGTYTKIGRSIQLGFDIQIGASGIGTAGTYLSLTNLPFVSAASNGQSGAVKEVSATGIGGFNYLATTGQIIIQKYDGTFLGGNSYRIIGLISYYA